MEKRKILAISGSTRKNSSNEKILSFIKELHPHSLDVTIFTAIDQLPHFNPDISENDLPASVINFLQMIEDAEGVIICTPEYVFSLPGTLKNALEWTVSTTVFSYKPFAFIIASASGEKAFEALDLIMKTLLQQEIPDSSKLLIKGGKGKVNDDGKMSDETAVNQIETVVDSLLESINKSKA
jgi:NAD(P)H-dependent FMN reductase